MRAYTEIDEEEERATDTEVTLGMTSLLGIFFGLVLVCGVFFGFGYSLGRGSSSAPAQSAHASAAPAAESSTSAARPDADTLISEPESPDSTSAASPGRSSSKDQKSQYEYVPTPGGPARLPVGGTAKQTTVIERLDAASAAKASGGAQQSADSRPLSPKPAPASPVSTNAAPAAKRSAATLLPAPPNAASAANPSGSPAPAATPTMVQIAAVSRQEDADVLVSALRKRGYSVAIRNEPKDHLLHVQIGPFATRDEAKAMRAKLLADGYNAILK